MVEVPETDPPAQRLADFFRAACRELSLPVPDGWHIDAISDYVQDLEERT